jgi:hypothetical protein
MEISERTQLFIRILCLIVIIALCVAIWHNGKGLSCSKCSVNFENRKEIVDKGYSSSFNVSIEELYNSHISTGECPLSYSKDFGFMYSGGNDGNK